MKKRVGILTSGGDCPGLNATIRGVAKALYARMGDNVEIVGIANGYSGLINGDYREMNEDDFRGILTLGGTILGTKRTPFKLMRVVEDDNIDKVAAMKKTYKAAKLDCLLCLGGNGTHKTANLLSQEGLNIIGLPKTIDNDIYGTDVTFGFHTAVDIATEVAKSKIEMGKAVFDPARERSKLNNLASRAPERYEAQTIALFRLLMSMSKAEQQRYINELKGITISQKAHATAAAFDTPFPQTATVACQGVEGAYSQIAACKLFDVPDIAFFETFEGVMRAVRDGFCEFGVLPIENSTAGSVNAVYDLLAQFDFHIVRSLRLKIDHNLLVKPGTKLADIREVYSHGQAIAQCASFIESHDLHATKYPNTAMSAEMVANSGRTDVAAIASRSCAALYGLEVLESNIQDSDNNYTRFVVISREPRVYPGANRTSLMITTANEPGALYRVLERFYALNINLIKLESRPIPGRDFEFMFYFDLDCPFGSKALDDLLDSIDDVCESFTYFGSYTEVL